MTLLTRIGFLLCSTLAFFEMSHAVPLVQEKKKMTFYDFEVQTIEGTKTTLADKKGMVLLIVNVASNCGFTAQYEGLEKLYQKYKSQKFEVLGFPCNQFAGQEPGTNEEIKKFCSLKFHVTFPMFSKIDVNGEHAHPLFEYLKSQQKGVLNTERIKWNFTKFLVSRTGEVVKRFAPNEVPESLTPDIEALLK